MPLNEPKAWTQARMQRLAAMYPAQFAQSTPDQVIGTDAYTAAQGGPVSPFSTTAMRLAAFAGENQKEA